MFLFLRFFHSFVLILKHRPLLIILNLNVTTFSTLNFSESFQKVLMCLSGIAIKLPEGEFDTEPEEKVGLSTDFFLQKSYKL